MSQLVDAKELASIVYTKSSGEAVPETTVEIVRSTRDSLLIQEAYGSSFTIAKRNVVSRRAVGSEEWKRAKMAELERRRGELAEASEEDRVNKLYLLALYAKTHGEPELGDEFLAQAVGLDAFEWFLTAFYPDRADAMLALRDAARGRRGESDAAIASAVESEAAASASDAKPDSDPLDAVPEDEGALLSFADRYFKEGSRCLRESLAGEESGAWRKRALACFEHARDALEALGESHPDYERARRLRQDLVSMIQTSAKDAGFFD